MFVNIDILVIPDVIYIFADHNMMPGSFINAESLSIFYLLAIVQYEVGVFPEIYLSVTICWAWVIPLQCTERWLFIF